MEVLIHYPADGASELSLLRRFLNGYVGKAVSVTVEETLGDPALGTRLDGTILRFVETTSCGERPTIAAQIQLTMPLHCYGRVFGRLLVSPRHGGGFLRLTLTRDIGVYAYGVPIGIDPTAIPIDDLLGIWSMKFGPKSKVPATNSESKGPAESLN